MTASAKYAGKCVHEPGRRRYGDGLLRKGDRTEADDLGGGSFQIKLKGASIMPDHGLMIQPNTLSPGRGKTLITVMKKTD